ncbi:uncharacterized protein LOC126369439 [Pectinophora gossypiella]|uniref:uncharacterized protein LOC126369439 n=1 Tax=Pectinophora gossypiella TaxID=13191 RepID=UPI00214E149E|nr:uncharacterized protein LOC126369439 [Pectinophora gossypiella]
MNCLQHNIILILLTLTSVMSLATQQSPEITTRYQEFIPDIPKECTYINIGICENVPNYPKKYIADILGKMTHRKEIKVRQNTLNVTNNIWNANGDFPLCDSIEQEIIPKAARDKSGNWYFVVNEDENPIHQYLAVQCNFRTNKSCKDFVFLSGVYSVGECRQKHVEVRMLVINKFGMAINETFQVPSCCSCVATRKIQALI